jgi:hypothetical protein
MRGDTRGPSIFSKIVALPANLLAKQSRYGGAIYIKFRVAAVTWAQQQQRQGQRQRQPESYRDR